MEGPPLEALTGKDTFSCRILLCFYKYFSTGTLVLLISGLQIINEVLNVVHHTFSCKNRSGEVLVLI